MTSIVETKWKKSLSVFVVFLPLTAFTLGGGGEGDGVKCLIGENMISRN